MSESQTIWHELLARLGVTQARAAILWQGIATAYTEPHRHYHGLSHIDALATALEPLKSRLEDPDAALLALVYHDIVYDPARADNEERSADRLASDVADSARAQRHILATKHHNSDDDPDTNLVLDLDMGILGASWPAYLTYAQGVFREYLPVYGRDAYAKGRAELFLKPTLNKPRIFLTAEFAGREDQARQNLQTEIDLWASGGFA